MTDPNNKYYALLGDSPVLEAGRPDLLAFNATARVLAGAAVATSDPMTIGIFGEWGTGMKRGQSLRIKFSCRSILGSISL